MPFCMRLAFAFAAISSWRREESLRIAFRPSSCWLDLVGEFGPVSVVIEQYYGVMEYISNYSRKQDKLNSRQSSDMCIN